jgi:hypothetical protein
MGTTTYFSRAQVPSRKPVFASAKPKKRSTGIAAVVRHSQPLRVFAFFMTQREKHSAGYAQRSDPFYGPCGLCAFLLLPSSINSQFVGIRKLRYCL